MAFRSTEGNGGPPIITGREPVEKPEIVRGSIVGPEQADGDGLAVGSRCTVTLSPSDPEGQAGFAITIHDAVIVGQASDETAGIYHWLLDVTPATVVTWDRLPATASQI